jgi:hypothetical protein
MENVRTLTPVKAVLLGHVFVTLPVLLLIGTGAVIVGLISNHSSGPLPFSLLGVLGGAAVGWIWWSATVPLWREWAKHNGADEERTQLLAQRSGLVWPRGSFFEKTEFRMRKRL